MIAWYWALLIAYMAMGIGALIGVVILAYEKEMRDFVVARIQTDEVVFRSIIEVVTGFQKREAAHAIKLLVLFVFIWPWVIWGGDKE